MQMIVLTEAQADTFRGPTGAGAELYPIPLADGVTWVLPARVLEDEAHSAVKAALSALPRRDVKLDEFKPPEDQ